MTPAAGSVFSKQSVLDNSSCAILSALGTKATASKYMFGTLTALEASNIVELPAIPTDNASNALKLQTQAQLKAACVTSAAAAAASAPQQQSFGAAATAAGASAAVRTDGLAPAAEATAPQGQSDTGQKHHLPLARARPKQPEHRCLQPADSQLLQPCIQPMQKVLAGTTALVTGDLCQVMLANQEYSTT